MTTATYAKSELTKWQEAVENSLNTIHWLEQRNDQKTARINALETRLKHLEGRAVTRQATATSAPALTNANGDTEPPLPTTTPEAE